MHVLTSALPKSTSPVERRKSVLPPRLRSGMAVPLSGAEAGESGESGEASSAEAERGAAEADGRREAAARKEEARVREGRMLY